MEARIAQRMTSTNVSEATAREVLEADIKAVAEVFLRTWKKAGRTTLYRGDRTIPITSREALRWIMDAIRNNTGVNNLLMPF